MKLDNIIYFENVLEKSFYVMPGWRKSLGKFSGSRRRHSRSARIARGSCSFSAWLVPVKDGIFNKKN